MERHLGLLNFLQKTILSQIMFFLSRYCCSEKFVRGIKKHTHTHTLPDFTFLIFFFFIVKAKKLCILMGHLATTSVWKRSYDNDVEKKRKALFCLLFHKTAKTNRQESGCQDVVTRLQLLYLLQASFPSELSSKEFWHLKQFRYFVC